VEVNVMKLKKQRLKVFERSEGEKKWKRCGIVRISQDSEEFVWWETEKNQQISTEGNHKSTRIS
jgi:hypothetical protein